jgi:ABC-type sugar transport system ATPase subunit
VVTLSGGNQQKVLVTRWLWAQPRFLILAEPTAGVDVGTRHALYELIREQAKGGMAVLVASSDVDDLVELCDRVVTLRSGRAVDESVGAEITAARLVALMEGVDN